MQLPLFQLKLNTFLLVHRRDHFVSTSVSNCFLSIDALCSLTTFVILQSYFRHDKISVPKNPVFIRSSEELLSAHSSERTVWLH